jgi:aspartate ammonia-lyase
VMVCVAVNANHSIIADCASRGSLQINEFLPLIAYALLESIDLLTNIDTMLATHVEGITCDSRQCARNAFRGTSLIAAFLPHIGYERAQDLVREFNAGGEVDFRAFLSQRLGAELVEKILSPAQLMALGYREEGIQETEFRSQE